MFIIAAADVLIKVLTARYIYINVIVILFFLDLYKYWDTYNHYLSICLISFFPHSFSRTPEDKQEQVNGNEQSKSRSPTPASNKDNSE